MGEAIQTANPNDKPSLGGAPAQGGSATASRFVLSHGDILRILPHRYPFLLVDGVVSLEEGKSIQAIKNVSFGEPFFTGHFPENPVMPGVLQIEALAQACCILVAQSFAEEAKGKRPALAGINDARFRRPVYPGDTLTLRAELEKARRGVYMLKSRAEVDGELAAEAGIIAFMV